MSIAITFSGMLGDRPTVSDLFRRPERENRPPYMVSSVGDVLFGPKSSDHAELTLDRLRDTPELHSDLSVGVPFHLPPRHRALRVIAQAAIEPPAFLMYNTLLLLLLAARGRSMYGH